MNCACAPSLLLSRPRPACRRALRRSVRPLSSPAGSAPPLIGFSRRPMLCRKEIATYTRIMRRSCLLKKFCKECNILNNYRRKACPPVIGHAAGSLSVLQRLLEGRCCGGRLQAHLLLRPSPVLPGRRGRMRPRLRVLLPFPLHINAGGHGSKRPCLMLRLLLPRDTAAQR